MEMSTQDKNKSFAALVSGPPGAPSKQILAGPRKNSAACLPCKQAKRKCSGSPAPCKACRGAESECVFDLSLDLRRKVAQRRTLDEREYYRHVLYFLLDALRSSKPARITELVNFIRSNDSISCIATALANSTISLDYLDSVDLGGDPSVEETILSLLPPPGPYSDTYSRIRVENLVDIPLFKVPAKPWTNLSDDDDHVAHLISLYFTWDHPCSQLVDQTIFLRHMSSGDLNSEYCTPFLANIILSTASVYSDAPEVFPIPGNADTCGLHFYMEAERLWKAEEGNVTLANVQGLTIMSHVLKCQGKEKLSWLVLRQAVQLAQDLGLFQGPRTSHQNQKMPAEMQHVRAITAWGIFMMNWHMSIKLQKNANLEWPVCRPYAQENLGDIAWVPYPRSNQVRCTRRPALLRYVMTELANLTEITVNMHMLFGNTFKMDVDDLWRETNKLQLQLCRWRENLPNVDDYPVPQVLFLHIRYHQEILSLFNSFLDHENSKCMSHLLWFEQARCTRIPSAKDIARYVRLLRLSYGHKRIPTHMLEATNSSLLVLLGDLQSDGARDAFVELLGILVVFGRRLKQARGMAHTIKSIAQQSAIVLPPEAVLILENES